MENKERYCKECGECLFELDFEYCDECKEGIEIIKKLKDHWVMSEDLKMYTDESLNGKTIDEFEKELSDLEKKLEGYDNGVFDHYIESQYPPDKYEEIQIRLEKIKRILRVD